MTKTPCVPKSQDKLRWWEHYETPRGVLKRRTVEGFWCDKHHKSHGEKVVKIETVRNDG